MFVKKKKKIFVFSAARFIVSEWLMIRNYPDIITYAFCKKRVITDMSTLFQIVSKISNSIDRL
jgi:membrane-bound acyltransferase YfiQ involved in biofilm formation